MSVTILEALQNAQINLCSERRLPIQDFLGKSQLTNGVTLLEKGYPLGTEVEPLLDQYGEVDKVPEFKP